MAHGKDAALDLVYGRKGGHRAAAGAGQLAQELAAERNRHKNTHRDRPCDANLEHPECRWCHPDLPPPGSHFRPTTPEGWAARARMAAARRHAGLPLSHLDTEALDRAGGRP